MIVLDAEDWFALSVIGSNQLLQARDGMHIIAVILHVSQPRNNQRVLQASSTTLLTFRTLRQ